MAQNEGGCLGAVILLAALCGIGSCVRSCEKSENKRIREDYSSPPSEMGNFTPSYDGGVHARDFTVRNGVGYLTLEDGEVIKLKRTGDGRYSGLNYDAVQTVDGYRIIRHGKR